MNNRYIILAILASIVLVAIVTLKIFRTVIRLAGLKEIFEDGVVLSEDGLEIPRLFWLGRTKVPFDQVKSVELVAFGKALIKGTFLGYGIGMQNFITRPCAKEVVIIKFRWPCFSMCIICTPKNSAAFVEQLKSRISVL